jgi:hypothetical protein
MTSDIFRHCLRFVSSERPIRVGDLVVIEYTNFDTFEIEIRICLIKGHYNPPWVPDYAGDYLFAGDDQRNERIEHTAIMDDGSYERLMITSYQLIQALP